MNDETRSAPSAKTETVELIVPEGLAGIRLDQFLSGQFAEFSRSHLRRIIDAGGVTVDGKKRKPSFSLTSGASICVDPIDPVRKGPDPEDIPIELLYEDEVLAVVNKRSGMVVHPGRGNWKGTLAGALAFHFDQLSMVAGATRPGIVHRLDRDTSGVLVIAKTDRAHATLADQFKARTVEKEYLAIVVGRPDRDRDWIEGPIGDHPRHRVKKAIRAHHPSSRPAKTFYEVVERLGVYTLVKALPKTGRTHQIRLHLKSIGCPVLCDRLYGGRAEIRLDEIQKGDDSKRGRGSFLQSTLRAVPEKDPRPLFESLRAVPEKDPRPLLEPLLARQALHAQRLAFDHPITGERREFIAPMADDMAATLDALRSVSDFKKGTTS